jgi:aspartate racemase
MLVDHDPTVPSRQEAILGDGEDPGPALAAMARRLEAAGADFLVIPCNTAYAFQQSIIDAVDIPLLSIIDETISALPQGCAAVGLLATDGCLKAEEMIELMEAIYTIKAGKTNDTTGATMRALAMALVARGADAVIAGCTEIPLVLEQSMLEVPLLASTDILAQKTVQLALSE